MISHLKTHREKSFFNTLLEKGKMLVTKKSRVLLNAFQNIVGEGK